jgi:tripartite ATP-independent transporter DctM subunit
MPIAVIFPIILLFALLASGTWISLSLMGVGLGSLALFRNLPLDKVLAQTVWNGLASPELVALPLFVLMAELLFRSKFVNGLFRAIEPWVRHLPGGLLHTNVIGCTLFAMISGSSAATTSAIGRITLNELSRRGYDQSAAIGSLAGAGTLGFLIPPSIIMIIYGVLAQTSILKLFAAGIVPGLVLAMFFMAFLILKSLISDVGGTRSAPQSENIWRERLQSLPSLLPFLSLMTVLLGSMYGGLASPAEAAALSVGVTMVIMLLERTLSIKAIIEAGLGTARTTSMLGLIIAAASFLSTTMGYLGLPQAFSVQVQLLDLSPIGLITLLMVVYIVLGCFLEGMSMIVMTLPIVLPMVLAAGYDKIWFGVFLIIVVEMAQITPPVGMNLFVIQGLTGKSLSYIARAALPFFMIMVGTVFLIAVFPEIVTWLPSKAS